MFNRIGEISFKPDAASPDDMLEAAIEAGAEDVESSADGHLIVTSFEALGQVAGSLEERFGEPDQVKAVWKPTLTAQVDEERAQTILKLIAALDDDDDVQAVFSNFEVDEATLARLTAA